MLKINRYYRTVLLGMLIAFIMALIFAFGYRLYRSSCYKNAQEMIVDGYYDEAKNKFEKLGEYRDCKSYLKLLSAIDFIEQQRYEEAVDTLQSLGNFADAPSRLFRTRYEYAQYLYESGYFNESLEIFTQLANEARPDGIDPEIEISIDDIDKWLSASRLAYAQQLFGEGRYSKVIETLSHSEGNDRQTELLTRSKYAYGQQLFSQMDYSSAIALFEELNDFSDSKEWLDRSKYSLALELREENDVIRALDYFLDLGNYKKSSQYAEEILASGVKVDADVLYKAACKHFDAKLYWQALSEFKSLDGYNDSETYVEETTIMLRRSLSTTVSVGQKYSVALDKDGNAYATGYNFDGQSNVYDDNWANLVSISGFSDVTAGLKIDGTVITTSGTLNNEIKRADSPWQDTDIVAISVGNAYIIGLDSNGTLKSAGHDAGDGQRDVDDWKDIVAIATGSRHTVGLNSTGNVLITGYRSSRQFNQIQSDKDSWSDIIAIAAGGGNIVGNGHTVGLRKDGKVVAVGDNEFNQCEVGQWENIISIAAGDWFTMGLDKDGNIFITKPSQDVIDKYDLYTDVLNVENWSNTGIVSIAAGGGSAIGLYDSGHVIAAGYGKYDQKTIANNWSDIMVNSRS